MAAGAQTAVPYELARVGSEIDRGEREYFLLFPALGDADTLRIVRAGPDSVAIGSRSTRRLALSMEQARVLDAALASYEALFSAPDDAPSTVRIAGLLQWRLPFDRRPAVILTLRDGAELRGELLHADTEGVVLATESVPIQDLRDAGGLVWVPAHQLVRARQPGFRSRLDVRPEGDPVRYATDALPALQRQATFLRGLPPEVRAWRRERPPGPASTPPATDRYTYVPLSRWQIGVQAGLGAVEAGAVTTDPYGVPPPREEVLDGYTIRVSSRLGYNVTAALGLEVAARYYVSEVIVGVEVDRRRYAAWVGEVTGSYALLRPRLIRPSLTVRAGVSAVRATAATKLLFVDEVRGLSAEDTYSESLPVRVGGVVGVEGAVRLSRGASLVAEGGWAVYRGLTEGELVLTDPHVRVDVKRVEPRSADFRFRGIEAGIVFHL